MPGDTSTVLTIKRLMKEVIFLSWFSFDWHMTYMEWSRPPLPYFSKELILILLGLFQSNVPCIQRLYLLFRANAGCFFRKALKSLFGLIYPLQQFDGIQLNNKLKTLNFNTFKGNESVVSCNQYCPKYQLK